MLEEWRSGVSRNLYVRSSREKITDDQGRFVFEHVIPDSSGRIFRLAAKFTPDDEFKLTHWYYHFEIPPLEVKANETARVVLGGVGRPVIGRFAIPDERKAKWNKVIPLGWIYVDSPKPKQYEQFSKDEKERWWESVRWKRYRQRYCAVQSDGAFRFEDIPAGTYALNISVSQRHPIEFTDVRLGETTRATTVPKVPGAATRTEEPLDLGSLPFELDRGVQVGDLAPDLQADTLQGKKPLKLSEYRGRFVLIIFWTSRTVLNRPETLALRAAYSVLVTTPGSS
jgi:hypothetical protein